jgi:putative transposase
VKCGFIFEHKAQFSIQAMCRVLEVSPSGYYRWCSQPKSKRAKENEELLGKIREIHTRSRQNYGSPKIYRPLRQQGQKWNHKRVERLMRKNGIAAKRVKKFKVTTNSKHNQPVAESLLDRAFRVEEPDKVWVSDSPMCGPTKGGCIWRSFSICIRA